MLTQRHARSRWGWLVGAGLLLVVVLFSGSFGRAEPTGHYRPALPPDALTNGCWPLPPGVRLDFPHQVRRDSDLGGEDHLRRRLVLQYDVVDEATALAGLRRAFTAGGFTPHPGPRPGMLAFHSPTSGAILASLTPLPGVPEDSIVRGTIVLNLPSTPVQSDSPVCADPFSTKRFGPSTGDHA
ncbi:hypothetical protein [Nocardioides sp.]|uniref:hypothetical protein n=1 Tax=Nocardioides sp. TaxID=35761 RepID=UPI003D0A4ABF